jgi:hypothetical protein
MDSLFLSIVAYAWRVLVNLIMLTIVVGTLVSARGRFEITVIAILGLIYVVIRSIGIGQGMAYVHLASGLDAELTRIRELLGDDRDLHRDEMDELRKIGKGRMGRLYVDSAFLSIAFFICLYWLATATDLRPF